MKYKIVILACFATFSTASAQSDPKASEQLAPPTQSLQVQPAANRSAVVISGLTLICKGSETMLKVEGDYESFEWNTGSKERIIRVREEGIYEVTVVTKGGCRITSAVNVQVRLCT
jgi:hypothetical protein